MVVGVHEICIQVMYHLVCCCVRVHYGVSFYAPVYCCVRVQDPVMMVCTCTCSHALFKGFFIFFFYIVVFNLTFETEVDYILYANLQKHVTHELIVKPVTSDWMNLSSRDKQQAAFVAIELPQLPVSVRRLSSLRITIGIFIFTVLHISQYKRLEANIRHYLNLHCFPQTVLFYHPLPAMSRLQEEDFIHVLYRAAHSFARGCVLKGQGHTELELVHHINDIAGTAVL